MSGKKKAGALRKPKTQKDHLFEDCVKGMGCETCMGRCYDDSHIFWNGGDKPCDCGEFANSLKLNQHLSHVLLRVNKI